MNKLLIGKKQVADWLGVTIETLDKWEEILPIDRVGPVGRTYYVLEADLERWVRDINLVSKFLTSSVSPPSSRSP